MYDGKGTPDLSTEIWPWVVGHFARDPYTELVRILFAEPALRCFTLFSMTDEGFSHSSLFLFALNRLAPFSIVIAGRSSFKRTGGQTLHPPRSSSGERVRCGGLLSEE